MTLNQLAEKNGFCESHHKGEKWFFNEHKAVKYHPVSGTDNYFVALFIGPCNTKEGLKPTHHGYHNKKQALAIVRQFLED